MVHLSIPLPSVCLHALLCVRARDRADAQSHRRSSMAARSRSYRSLSKQAGATRLSDNARACRLAKVAARELASADELLAEVA